LRRRIHLRRAPAYHNGATTRWRFGGESESRSEPSSNPIRVHSNIRTRSSGIWFGRC